MNELVKVADADAPLYDELAQAELVEYLAAVDERFDAVVAGAAAPSKSPAAASAATARCSASSSRSFRCATRWRSAACRSPKEPSLRSTFPLPEPRPRPAGV